MFKVPELLKLGVVPDWLMVRLPPTSAMVPVLAWWAEGLARVVAP